MSTRKQHLVAFIALLFPAILFANSTNVTFDAALTNATGWAYSDDIKKNNTGYFVAGHKARITSASFNFAVTSIVIHVRTTPSCTRNLIISSYNPETSSISLSQTFSEIQTGANDLAIAAIWHPSDQVRSVSIDSTDGAQNLYFLSAVISGVPLIEPPTNLQTNDVKGTRCRLLWTNPANAVSNRIDVSRVVNHEMAGEVLDDYDFAEFTNSGGNPIDRTADFIAQYPDFAGSSLIYIPAYTAGNIQISTDNQKGFLVHAGLSDCSDVTLLLSLKIPNNSQGMTFGIGYEAATGVTNEVATIPMDLEFKTNRVSIAKIPADTPIIFNTQGANSKRRVIIDYLAFVRDYSPSSVSTNLVKTVFSTGNAARIRGLSPYSSYIAYVTAFDADGNESEPSEPISFMTNGAELPLVIKLQ